jgi:DNA-binding Lrp family transcriptional regulator
MGKPPGTIVLSILAALKNDGPMTRSELVQELGISRNLVSACLSRLNKKHKTVPKRVYIAHYQMDSEAGGRKYPRASYDIGDKPDAKKMKASPTQVSAHYRENMKGRVSSVFDLALSLRDRARTKQSAKTLKQTP